MVKRGSAGSATAMGGRWPRAWAWASMKWRTPPRWALSSARAAADRRVQGGGAVTGEQRQQAAGEHAQVDAVRGGAQEQRLGAGHGLMQAVLGAMRAGAALVLDQGGEVSGIFDLGVAVEAARMGGEQLVAVEDAHGVEGRQHGEAAPDMAVRHRVVVKVEAHVRGLAARSPRCVPRPGTGWRAGPADRVVPRRTARRRCGPDLPGRGARRRRRHTRPAPGR